MATLYTRKRYALAPFLGNGPYIAYMLVILSAKVLIKESTKRVIKSIE